MYKKLKQNKDTINKIKKKIIENLKNSLQFVAGEVINDENDLKTSYVPVAKCKRTFFISILVSLLCINLLCMSFFRKGLDTEMCLIILMLSLAIMVITFLAGGNLYKRYKDGNYESIKGIVIHRKRNIVGSIFNVSIITDDGEHMEFKVEDGIKLKKRRRYEFCYYESAGENFIMSAKILGKYKRSQMKEMLIREENDETE